MFDSDGNGTKWKPKVIDPGPAVPFDGIRFPTGDKHKFDGDKTKWHLLPWEIIKGIAEVMTFGANKYTENGWKEVPRGEDRYWSALMRHRMAMNGIGQKKEYTDKDSGLPHWAHFCCNAIFIGYFALMAHGISKGHTK